MNTEIAKVLARAMNSCQAHEGEPTLSTIWGIANLVSKEPFIKTNLPRIEKVLEEMIVNGLIHSSLQHDQRFFGLTDKGIAFCK